MFPELFLGEYSISMYCILEGMAVFSVILLALQYNHSVGSHYPISPYILFWIMLPAVFMGRVLFFLFYLCPGRYEEFSDLSYGGNMFLGVLIGAMMGIVAYCEYKHLPKLSVLDLFAPYLPIGGIIGRLACLCAGCCYGKPTTMPWGIVYPPHCPAYVHHRTDYFLPFDAAHSLPVHPSQIYAMIGWAIIFACLLYLRKRRVAPGVLITTCVMLYLCKRFVVDFFRDDYPVFFWGLDLMQVLAVPVVLVGFLIIYTLQRRAHTPLPASCVNETCVNED